MKTASYFLQTVKSQPAVTRGKTRSPSQNTRLWSNTLLWNTGLYIALTINTVMQGPGSMLYCTRPVSQVGVVLLITDKQQLSLLVTSAAIVPWKERDGWTEGSVEDKQRERGEEREREGGREKEREREREICSLLNVPTTCRCISGTDLLRQFYVLPRRDRNCRWNFSPHPVTVYWHRT